MVETIPLDHEEVILTYPQVWQCHTEEVWTWYSLLNKENATDNVKPNTGWLIKNALLACGFSCFTRLHLPYNLLNFIFHALILHNKCFSIHFSYISEPSVSISLCLVIYTGASKKSHCTRNYVLTLSSISKYVCLWQP